MDMPIRIRDKKNDSISCTVDRHDRVDGVSFIARREKKLTNKL